VPSRGVGHRPSSSRQLARSVSLSGALSLERSGFQFVDQGLKFRLHNGVGHYFKGEDAYVSGFITELSCRCHWGSPHWRRWPLRPRRASGLRETAWSRGRVHPWSLRRDDHMTRHVVDIAHGCSMAWRSVLRSSCYERGHGRALSRRNPPGIELAIPQPWGHHSPAATQKERRCSNSACAGLQAAARACFTPGF